MSDHRALRELWIFLEKGVENLIMLTHRIVEPLRQMERENARPLNFLAQLIDEPVEALVAGDFGDEAMKMLLASK
jgi:predicted Fe-Mo cluster-binding NifX family protein